MSRKRLLVLNQYYWPGVEATAHLLTELCEALAEDHDVTVVTGRLHGHEELPGDEVRNGVRIVRVASTSLERSKLLARGLNYVTFLTRALARALREPRPDAVVTMTDPPMVGDIGLVVARRFRAPLLVISEDVFPEIALELKRLENPIAIGLLRRLVALYLRRADRIVAIGETMRRRLEAKGAPPDRISVIPNWVDTTAITPAQRDNGWARRRNLVDGFNVMHSGNVGHAQDLDNLVHSATMLRDLDDLRIVIVGFGARHQHIVELAEQLEVGAVRFLPYQRRDALSQSLSTADVHFVGLVRGLSGYVVPSRLYGILAAGRPAIVAADADSETAQLVASIGCGVVVPPGQPNVLAATIRDLHARRDELDGMGRRGREYVVREADRTVAIERYRALLRGLV